MEKLGKEVGDRVNKKTAALYATLKNKFTGNDYANQSLQRLAEKPEDEDRQTTMKGVLKEALAYDPQLQAALRQLLAEVKQLGGDTIVQVSGGGAAATHGGVAAGAGGRSRQGYQDYPRPFRG